MHVLAGAMFAAAVLGVTPALASGVPRNAVPPDRALSANFSEFSAAQRKRPAHPAPVVTAPVIHPGAAWTGPDPTRGPGVPQLRALQAQGRCVIDEGYGRYSSCSNE